MSAKILQFERPEPRVDVIEGPAYCLGCGHRWHALQRAGDNGDLECPKCRTMRGTWFYLFEPEHALLVCNCGCRRFVVSGTAAVLCARCGARQGEFLQQ